MTTKIRKLKEKSLSTLIHDLDGVFSRFIRYRDMVNGRIPCFICGTKMSFQEAQCMHYIHWDKKKLKIVNQQIDAMKQTEEIPNPEPK